MLIEITVYFCKEISFDEQFLTERLCNLLHKIWRFLIISCENFRKVSFDVLKLNSRHFPNFAYWTPSCFIFLNQRFNRICPKLIRYADSSLLIRNKHKDNNLLLFLWWLFLTRFIVLTWSIWFWLSPWFPILRTSLIIHSN